MGIFSERTDTPNRKAETTIIAPGTHLEGELKLNCHLHVEGNVKGKIDCNANIVIGKQGKVDGKIKGKHVTVSGLFDGECTADVVEISEGGELKGTVVTPSLIIKPGGRFSGSCQELNNKKAQVTELKSNQEKEKVAASR